MVLSFWLQMIFGVAINFLSYSGIVVFDSYWPTTAHPLFRLPVFVMGVCAGVLCVRLQGLYSVLS